MISGLLFYIKRVLFLCICMYVNLYVYLMFLEIPEAILFSVNERLFL